jgi:hypothetical protein
MKEPDIPVDEAERVNVLKSLDIVVCGQVMPFPTTNAGRELSVLTYTLKRPLE